MKKMKKIASLMLAVAMILTLPASVFAQKDGTVTPNTASITVQNASKGATYKVYKIFDATYASDTVVAYTYKGNKWNNNQYFALDSQSKAVTAKAEALSTNSTSSSLADAELSTGAIEFLKELKEEPANRTVKSDGSALTFDGLAYGYYLIESDLNGGGAVAVDSTTPNATMYDKNVTEPTWDENNGKKIVSVNGVAIEPAATEASAAFGETVTFQLSVKTQNYAETDNEYKQIKEYVIKDKFNAKSFGNVNITGVKVIHGTQETTVGNYEVDPNSNITDNFTVTVPWTETVGEETKSLYESGDTLVITYTVTLKDTAEIAGSGNKNTASLGWNYTDNTEGPDEESQKTTEATVYTYALAINKVNSEGTALEGAEFEIKKGNSTVKVSALNIYGVYKYDTTGNAIPTSPQSGLIVIKGVAAGEYTVRETKAPNGYNLLNDSQTVEATLTRSYTTKITYYLKNGEIVGKDVEGAEEHGSADTGDIKIAGITVVNKAGSLLPSTGGIGTTIFYIIGGILVVGAAVLLVTKKRMGREA